MPRFVSVKASAWDREGEAFEFDCSDWTARIVQHEYDHLEGQLYIDHMDTSTFSHEVERWKWPLLRQDIEYVHPNHAPHATQARPLRHHAASLVRGQPLPPPESQARGVAPLGVALRVHGRPEAVGNVDLRQ